MAHVYLHAALHASCGGIVQAGALLVVYGIDVCMFILAEVKLGPRPPEHHLEALSTTLLILLWAAESRLQSTFAQHDVRAHAQHVQSRFIMHIALVGIPILAKQKGPGKNRTETGPSFNNPENPLI